MKCFSCNQRKGKRYCPAERSQICPRCCGEKRVIEIPCPEDCPHLASGQSYQSLKSFTTMLNRVDDPLRRRRMAETLMRFGGFIEILESEIVRYASDLRVLGDREVREAVETLRKTYQTEAKGIIFEHQSSNPLVQGLVRDLIARVDKEGSDSAQAVPATDVIIHCLELMVENIHFHEQSQERESYLQFIRRRHPSAGGRGSSDSSLVIPP